jgi:hypothetical protein
VTPGKTPTKAVDSERWRGRLDNARAFHQAVRDAVALADPDANANPILSNIVNAAIAYTDALTAKLKHVVNQRDHDAAMVTLRGALGNRFSSAEQTRLGRMLAAKEPAQYGARRGRRETAQQRLADLDAFAQWAEAELSR